MEDGLVVEVCVSLLSLNVALISCLFRLHGICAVSSSSLPRLVFTVSCNLATTVVFAVQEDDGNLRNLRRAIHLS